MLRDLGVPEHLRRAQGLLPGEISASSRQEEHSMYPLSETSHGPQMLYRNELKIGETKQRSRLILEHLKNVFDMK